MTRVQPAPVSLGARILILPGAAALWPYVLAALAESGRAMTRGHRTVHRLIWPVLAVVVVALGFTFALVMRPPPDAAAAEAQRAQPEPAK